MGNRAAEISEAIPIACWLHVKGVDNPADCVSRGTFPAELVGHDVWRKEPDWLRETEENWNKSLSFDEHSISSEECDIQKVLLPVIVSDLPLLEKI